MGKKIDIEWQDEEEAVEPSETDDPESGGGPGTERSSGRAEEASGDPGRTEEGPEAGTGEAESDRLSGEIRQELEELDDLRERHLRLAAEFENYRKRTRKELTETRERAQADLARRLLDALDDLDRVRETPVDASTVESLHEGVELVSRKLLKELRDAGLQRIEAEGALFDPNLHEAVLSVPTDDPEQDGRISRVFAPGYTFGDRLLRPARVEVRQHGG